MAAKTKKPKCKHAWVKKWLMEEDLNSGEHHAFRRCKKCQEPQWYWFCEERWKVTAPAQYVVRHKELKANAVRRIDDAGDCVFWNFNGWLEQKKTELKNAGSTPNQAK